MEPQNHEIVELVVEKNKVPFPYSSNIGTGYTEHIDLFDEIRITKHAHYFTGENRPEKIPLAVYEVDFPCEFLVLNVTHSGMFEGYSHEHKTFFNGIPGEHFLG